MNDEEILLLAYVMVYNDIDNVDVKKYMLTKISKLSSKLANDVFKEVMNNE